MKYFKKIVGEKVYLSPRSIEDAEIYTKWMNNLDIAKNLTTATNNFNIINETKYLEKSLETQEHTYAIVKCDNDEMIGCIGFNKINPINQTATLGIFIGEESEHSKGYGAEAIKLLLDYGFNYLNLHSVILSVYDFNEKAINCYKKVGFKEFGRRRECYYLKNKYYDIIYMDILKEEYINKAQ